MQLPILLFNQYWNVYIIDYLSSKYVGIIDVNSSSNLSTMKPRGKIVVVINETDY